MSPTENELRRSLSDGAGDVPDVEHIMSAAREQRGQRRKVALSVAGAVVLVGALGTGGAFLSHRGSQSDDSAASKRLPVVGPAAAPPIGTAAGVEGGPTAVTTCPAQVPNALLPGGGRNDRTGSSSALFAQPVHTITVCAYSNTDSTGGPSKLELTGSDATTLADSLENASKTAPRVCPDIRQADQKSLVIIATTADGTKLPTVTTTINEIACAVRVSNGTVVRYGWSPPASLQSRFGGSLPH